MKFMSDVMRFALANDIYFKLLLPLSLACSLLLLLWQYTPISSRISLVRCHRVQCVNIVCFHGISKPHLNTVWEVSMHSCACMR